MRRFSLPFVFALSAAFVTRAAAQGTLADYQRAERFLAPSADTFVTSLMTGAHWLGQTDRFWYWRALPGGREFFLVDPVRKTKSLAFDHARLSQALGRALNHTMRGDSLGLDSLVFGVRGDSLTIVMRDTVVRCTLTDYACTAARADSVPVGRSPDGRWVSVVRDYNLFVRSTETGAERQLTTDGIKDYAYATGVVNPGVMVRQGTDNPRLPAAVSWSPDSKRLLTFRMDTRRAGRLTMTQHAPPGDIRPRSYSYVYPLAGDSVLPAEELIVFEVDGWRRVPVKMEPLTQYYYGASLGRWYRDSRRVRLVRPDRGYTTQRLFEVDATTGESRVVVEERLEPYFDAFSSSIIEPVSGGAEILWASQRDGWNHLYLYDGVTGRLKRQLTGGDWVVRGIEHVDTARRVVYFTALGKEPRRDPYLSHLYSVSLDGGAPHLLTPESGNHAVTFSPTGAYFIDTYSRVDLPRVWIVRRSSDGAVVDDLEHADVSRLRATGWRTPEPFKALARDGKTEIYGLIWFPTNFDSTKRYPVVENVYTGPQDFHVPKDFFAFRDPQQAIAELGFIAVKVDGTGTAGRSRAFHDVSYKNLGSGVEDHIGALQQAAATRPYMDLSRVGVWGHSAGGYDAAHAILSHPEFYKVAVSSAGDHDARLDKAVWNAQWMGYPVGDHYAAQANATIAHNLRGKLFLMHGDVDDNVPMAETLRLVDALIKANKNFDLLIMPGQAHFAGDTQYFVRRRWDYFVKNLLGVEPPEYQIGAPGHAR